MRRDTLFWVTCVVIVAVMLLAAFGPALILELLHQR